MERVFFAAFLCLFCVRRPAKIKHRREPSIECVEWEKEKYVRKISRKKRVHGRTRVCISR